MNKNFEEQKMWTKFWAKVFNKSFEQEFWTKALDKSCEQKLLTKVVNKSCQQKLLTNTVNKQFTRIVSIWSSKKLLTKFSSLQI